jgi:hypothetical protein
MTSTIIDLSHHLLKTNITRSDTVVDATMGQGHDTLFLAQLAHHVYAFDVQPMALDITQKRLIEHNINNVTLIHDSHECIRSYIPSYKGVVFNLGYLPGHEKNIITTPTTTINALKSVIPALSACGFILVVCYPGHEGGAEETAAVRLFFSQLDDHLFEVIEITLPFQTHLPPQILFAKKRKGRP